MLASSRAIAALTVLLGVVFAASGWIVDGIDTARMPRELALIGLNALPLLAVRRNPLAVVAMFSVAYPLWVGFEHPTHELQSLPSFTAMYALGAWDRPLWVRALGLLMPVWMVGAAAAGLWDVDPIDLGYVAVMFAVVWALGTVVAGRRAYATALEQRTAELEAAQQELSDRAVAHERNRIARELHDIVAHAMSVITVQAGVGARLVDTRPGQAAGALEVIEQTGREALAEMRRMLAVLRDADPDGPVPEPQPGLADVPRLVDQAREVGVSLALTTVGAAPRLPAGLDLAAYRVVQEAVTNIVKHAPGNRGTITIRHDRDTVTVEVHNAVRQRPAAPEHRRGHGLRGMAERVALYGGQLETVADDDGFRVTARFPIEEPG